MQKKIQKIIKLTCENINFNICEFTNLQYLILPNVFAFDYDISTLISLKHIHLNNVYKPFNISNLSKLEYLKINVELCIMDNEINTLKNLQHLELHANSLSDRATENLTKIKYIKLNNIKHNKFTNGFKKSLNIYYLSMKNNDSKINGNYIKQLNNLVYLNLSLNKTIKDNHIKNLINLKKLNMKSNNLLTDEGIKNLINLEYIDLLNNENITNIGLKKNSEFKKNIFNK